MRMKTRTPLFDQSQDAVTSVVSFYSHDVIQRQFTNINLVINKNRVTHSVMNWTQSESV